MTFEEWWEEWHEVILEIRSMSPEQVELLFSDAYEEGYEECFQSRRQLP